jgi:hypothetical protein
MLWRDKTVKQHPLDASVIVEVFDVSEVWDRAAYVHMQARRAVCRKGTPEAPRNRCSLKEAGKAPAPCSIELQHIDGFRLKHSPEIQGIVSILPGSQLHWCWYGIPDTLEVLQPIGTHRFFKPGHIALRKFVSERNRLLRVICTVRIDKKPGFRSDCRTSHANSSRIISCIGSNLHLHRLDAIVHPA